MEETLCGEMAAARKSLLENCDNLEQVANYCEDNYCQSPDKRGALESTKNFTTQSLASVAYQVNTLATTLLQMLDCTAARVGDMESALNGINLTIDIRNERIGRQTFRSSLQTPKNGTRTQKVAKPESPSSTHKKTGYVSLPIDYSSLDDVGHGIKFGLGNASPRTSRSGSLRSISSTGSPHGSVRKQRSSSRASIVPVSSPTSPNAGSPLQHRPSAKRSVYLSVYDNTPPGSLTPSPISSPAGSPLATAQPPPPAPPPPPPPAPTTPAQQPQSSGVKSPEQDRESDQARMPVGADSELYANLPPPPPPLDLKVDAGSIKGDRSALDRPASLMITPPSPLAPSSSSSSPAPPPSDDKVMHVPGSAHDLSSPSPPPPTTKTPSSAPSKPHRRNISRRTSRSLRPTRRPPPPPTTAPPPPPQSSSPAPPFSGVPEPPPLPSGVSGAPPPPSSVPVPPPPPSGAPGAPPPPYGTPGPPPPPAAAPGAPPPPPPPPPVGGQSTKATTTASSAPRQRTPQAKPKATNPGIGFAEQLRQRLARMQESAENTVGDQSAGDGADKQTNNNNIPLTSPSSKGNVQDGSSAVLRAAAEEVKREATSAPRGSITNAPKNHDWAPKEYMYTATAIYDYTAQQPDEMTFCEDDVIYVTKDFQDGWLLGVRNGVTAMIPGNYVKQKTVYI